jgi:hypothetical protein
METSSISQEGRAALGMKIGPVPSTNEALEAAKGQAEHIPLSQATSMINRYRLS